MTEVLRELSKGEKLALLISRTHEIAASIEERDSAQATIDAAKTEMQQTYETLKGQRLPIEGSATGIIDSTGEFYRFKGLTEEYMPRWIASQPAEVMGADEQGAHFKPDGYHSTIVMPYEWLAHPVEVPPEIEM